jgi:spermidine synthase
VANIGLVGLGTGALATYGRAEDQFTFYEIDPLVIRFARDPKLFTYLSDCSKARMEFVLGDARFQLQNAPDQSYDLLVIDAFSSDSVPAHLMTREAIALYLSKIKPDGAVLFHLSNRYLELRDPVMKAVAELDGLALTQVRRIKRKSPYVASSTITVIATKSQKGMDPFRADPRWRGRDISQKHSWRDDHTNLIGTLRFSTPQE